MPTQQASPLPCFFHQPVSVRKAVLVSQLAVISEHRSGVASCGHDLRKRATGPSARGDRSAGNRRQVATGTACHQPVSVRKAVLVSQLAMISEHRSGVASCGHDLRKRAIGPSARGDRSAGNRRQMATGTACHQPVSVRKAVLVSQLAVISEHRSGVASCGHDLRGRATGPSARGDRSAGNRRQVATGTACHQPVSVRKAVLVSQLAVISEHRSGMASCGHDLRGRAIGPSARGDRSAGNRRAKHARA